MKRLLTMACLLAAAGCERNDGYLKEGQAATVNLGTVEDPVPTRVRIVHDVDPINRPVTVHVMEGKYAAKELNFERWAVKPSR